MLCEEIDSSTTRSVLKILGFILKSERARQKSLLALSSRDEKKDNRLILLFLDTICRPVTDRNKWPGKIPLGLLGLGNQTQFGFEKMKFWLSWLSIVCRRILGMKEILESS